MTQLKYGVTTCRDLRCINRWYHSVLAELLDFVTCNQPIMPIKKWTTQGSNTIEWLKSSPVLYITHCLFYLIVYEEGCVRFLIRFTARQFRSWTLIWFILRKEVAPYGSCFMSDILCFNVSIIHYTYH